MARVELGPLTEKNIGLLKKLSLSPPQQLQWGQISYYSDFAVGAIVCQQIDGCMHILGCSVLPAYCGLGCESALVSWVEDRARFASLKEVRMSGLTYGDTFKSLGYSSAADATTMSKLLH